MWGNRLGWIISLVLVLAMAGTVVATYIITGRRTEPTDFSRNPANLAAIQLPVDPRTLLPQPPKDENAGEIYWRAVLDHRANTEKYEKLVSVFKLQPAAELAGVKSALEAAECRKATIFTSRVDEAVRYGSSPAVTALHQIGGLLARIGTEYANKRQFAEAKTYLTAEYILGLRLYEERMTRQQLSAGLGLMAHAATVLGQIASQEGDQTLATKLAEYVKSQRTFALDQIEPMARVITSVDPAVQSKHVGDVFVIAHDSAERVWRVEATLKLGMYKYYTNTAGDRRAAIRGTNRLLMDPDPAIATAAGLAKDLTLESYRTIGAK